MKQVTVSTALTQSLGARQLSAAIRQHLPSTQLCAVPLTRKSGQRTVAKPSPHARILGPTQPAWRPRSASNNIPVARSGLVTLCCLGRHARTCLQPPWHSSSSSKLPSMCRPGILPLRCPLPGPLLLGGLTVGPSVTGVSSNIFFKGPFPAHGSEGAPHPSVTLSLSCFIFFTALVTH